MDEYKRRRRRSRAVMSMFLDSLGGSIDNVDVATFDSDGTDLKALVVGIDPVQDLHGYDNPWPAGGGKNLFNNTAQSSTIGDAQFTVNSDGTVTANATNASNAILDIGTFTLKAGVSYALNGCPVGGSVSTYRLYFGTSPGSEYDLGDGATITRETDTTLTLRIGISGTYSNLLFKPMLRLASVSDATFAPYSNICPISGHSSVNVIVSPTLNPLDGTITNIPLGTTVYGGTLDVLTGVLTVTKVGLDLGTPNYNGGNRNTEDTGRIFYITGLPVGNTTALCSIYAQGSQSWEAMHVNTFYLGASGTFMVCADYANATALKTAISGEMLVYELATPTTIQLTGQQIATFLGTNNVWCDSGKIIHLEY